MSRHSILGSILSLSALLAGCATNTASSVSVSDGPPPLKVFVNVTDLINFEDAVEQRIPKLSNVYGPDMYVVIQNVSAHPIEMDNAAPAYLNFEVTDAQGNISYVRLEPVAHSTLPHHSEWLPPGQVSVINLKPYVITPYGAFHFPGPGNHSKTVTLRAIYGDFDHWDQHSPSWHPAEGWVDKDGWFIGVVTSAPFKITLINDDPEPRPPLPGAR